ncbi:hypothetical protein Aple_025570 [Acrocarpospora pleiomorpha]|uniref:SDR family oxidoreductase n=1 Tax=Acrocarpospora pleiomorpha TaxID=90975 RepID=A0A5M3XJ05_9ACTN|nr:SDR family oxidoreductase [Acrocarpospora pleiomorpha]GES19661.1 hypothetical protein Aple_025570 [Acrocarpospora pleiomorpha]
MRAWLTETQRGWGFVASLTSRRRHGEEHRYVMASMHILNVPWVEPVDISHAVLWLASDEARYVTGSTVPVDAGALAPFTIPHATSES